MESLPAPAPSGTTGPASVPPAGGWLRGFPVWTYALHLLTLFGLALSNVLLGLTLLSAPWSWRRHPPPWRRLAGIALPLGAYVLLLVAASVASAEPRVSFASLTELISLTTLLLGPLLLTDERVIRRLVDAVTAMGGLLALYGLAQFFFGYGGLDRRIRGPFSHWMTFSGILLVCDLLLVAQLAVGTERRGPWRWGRWVVLVAINLGLLGSLTRSAWIALGVTLVAFLGWRRPRWLLALLPTVPLFVILAPVPLMSRALSTVDLSDGSNYDRLCMWDAGLRMVAERPLFGIGPDMVGRRYALYRHPTAPRYEVPHLHNNLLELAAERGLPGAATYVWLMAAPIALALRRYRREGGAAGPRADLYLGVVLALVAYNVAGLFEFNWGDTEVQRLVLFLLALPFCLEPVAPPAPPAGALSD